MAVVLLVIAGVAAASAASLSEWPGYLSGSAHGSSTSDGTVTTGNVGTLTKVWQFTAAKGTDSGQPAPGYYASPTVSGGRVYIGARTGVFYALDLATGAVVWQRSLGFQPTKTCLAQGISSTAAMGTDPSTHRAALYVAGGDGYLYSLDAASGDVNWRTVVGALPSATASDYYNWASPVVSAGVVYMGVTSDCDKPFIPGGLQAFDQASGTLKATYDTVAGPSDGGGVWTSPVVSASGDILVATGSGPPLPAPQGDMYSIVQLAAGTLDRIGAWAVPVAERSPDPDFASSPVPFTAVINGTRTDLVAACNKNGTLYAWPADDVSAGPVWQNKVGLATPNGVLACLAAPVWNGSQLFEAGNPTTIAGVPYQGSMRELDPATGTPLWQTGLGSSIAGSPSINANGILAASSFQVAPGGTNGTYLINAANGEISAFVPEPTGQFSQPVFAGGYLLLALRTGALAAYAPRSSGDTQPPSAPTGVQPTWHAGSSAVDLTWSPPADADIAAYRIFRDGLLIATTSASLHTYTDTTASSSTNYTYSVEAVDSSGNCSPLTAPVPIFAAEGAALFTDGFETGNLSNWTFSRSVSVESTLVDTGSWAALTSSTGSVKSSMYTTLPAQDPDIFFRTRFFVSSHGQTPTDLMTVKSQGGQIIAVVSLSLINHLIVRNRIAGTAVTGGRAVSLGAWHTLQLEIHVAGVDGASQLWLDGTPVPNAGGSGNFGDDAVAVAQLGDTHLGRQLSIAYDNVTIATSYVPD